MIRIRIQTVHVFCKSKPKKYPLNWQLWSTFISHFLKYANIQHENPLLHKIPVQAGINYIFYNVI